MGPLQLLLAIGGAVLAVFGAWRAWRPWQRMRALAANEANLRRYESWRGGRATDEPGPSSADLMRAELRRQVLRWGVLAVVGVALVLLSLSVRPDVAAGPGSAGAQLAVLDGRAAVHDHGEAAVVGEARGGPVDHA